MSKEAMKLALEGAANYIDALGGDSRKYRQTLASEAKKPDFWEGYVPKPVKPCGEATLAQQEPVAWMDIDEKGAFSGLRYWSEPDNRHEVALYASPPAQRTWQGLTDEEIEQGCKESWVTEQAWQSAVWWAEAKLRGKNENRN